MISPNESKNGEATYNFPSRVLIIACGALVRELKIVTRKFDWITIRCLPAVLHNTPKVIPEMVRQRVLAAKAEEVFDAIFVGYMDCGTGGLLDKVCSEESVQRLPGTHCYELLAGTEQFRAWQEAEPGTFYLTDYLVKHFDRIIMEGLGILKHPELLDMYFRNYTRVIHLAQTDDPLLTELAEKAADKLGLPCKRVFTGVDRLKTQVLNLRKHPNKTIPNVS